MKYPKTDIIFSILLFALFLITILCSCGHTETLSIEDRINAVVPSEELLFDNGLLADLKDRIVNECLMVLHESMCPSEVEFLVSLPNDSAGNKDYDSVRERIENDRNSAGN